MFDRRLKIVLWIIGLAMAALMARAGTIQIVHKDAWVAEAEKTITHSAYIQTTRGTIYDVKHRALAVDEACTDAAVEYAAVTEDWVQYKTWLHDRSVASCRRNLGETFKNAPLAKQKIMVATESQHIQQEVHDMWYTLEAVSKKTPDEMDDIRNSIIQTVEQSRTRVQWRTFESAVRKNKAAAPTWFSRIMVSSGPQLDDFSVDVGEQTQAHVILPAIDADTYNKLARRAEEMPGLVLQLGHRRVYPYGESASHVLGHVGLVDDEQTTGDPDKDNPLRQYHATDLAGKQGVEALFEQSLRGTRGEELTNSAGAGSGGGSTETIDPIPGHDQTLTLDIELEKSIEAAFAKPREWHFKDNPRVELRSNQPGAAVVIDLQDNQVRALVSYPNFDPNKWSTDYSKWAADDINRPLADRAAEAYQPGSIVKPMMALGALTDKVITPETQIQCTGYLILNGHRYTSFGKCWTMREYGITHSETSGEPLPDNLLRVPDAIERSCNVFFETVADKLGMTRQRYWCDRFGLGRPTGIGLPESSGHLPNPDNISAANLTMATCFAGIGQGEITATPLQMANVAATIARDGIWMRPKLLDDGKAPESVNLGLSPADIAAVKDGMHRVVHNPAGSGNLPAFRPGEPDDIGDMQIAGKTGTPQAEQLTIPQRDADGTIIIKDGREQRMTVDPNEPSIRGWYIAAGDDKKTFSHHWFIGFAPADHPRVAFAIFAEYGGSGAPVATAIVRDTLQACIEQGYLPKGAEKKD